MSGRTGTVAVGAARLYYETAGSGPAMVLVHAGIADCRMWDAQFAEFRSEFMVVRWDQRGCGKSPKVPGAFSRHDDLHAVVRALNIDRAVVVGASVGGKAAIDFALAHSEHVAALVLVAPSVGGYDGPRYASLDDVDEAEKRGDIAAAVELEVRLWLDGPRRTAGQVNARVRELVSEMNALTYQPGNAGDERVLVPPALSRLSEIHTPTLVVVGDQEHPDRIDLARRVGDDIPGARTVIVSGAAHMVSMERPREFNALVRDFLHSSMLYHP